ncbi:hypothetical protein CBR_g55376 [Chara braunii]|uniref:magnesium-protoporphyrin IX monomethyl ester (oxidative) cyclase n=1 Tax=Chara braunii TaxID=69332 RepID=A0A388MD95_CHABU|nr:hypothetical protein CBR_g55376 [Chara braunii]|eukprot:GBG92439.1 hypothetical protein CBR_g55376 [Chara braunii]
MAAVTSSAVAAAAMAAVASTSSAASATMQTKASSLSKCSSSLVPLSSSSSSSSFTPGLGSLSAHVMTRGSRRLALVSPRAATKVDVADGEKMRAGAKPPSKESLLTPRFYTTDFDEMEALLDPVNNPYYRDEEFVALLNEFKTDYNQTHFVRNKEFKEAAESLQGATREIFVEFLERSCTAEFSGFLLYKELGRRLKKKNPIVAEIFTLMSRDEARHAGIFPAVPDVESPEFKVRMDRLVVLNKQLLSIGGSDGPAVLKNFQKLPIIASMLWEMLVIFNMKPVDCGSMDFYELEPQVVY